MAISFKCGGCAKAYTVKDELAGKRAQCKVCGQVMKIPLIAPAHEPDLRADGGDGSPTTNAETVAGSLITSPLETVAGRGASAAGRSAMGRSASGRSVSHQAIPAEPEDYGQPPLSALKHVAAAEHEAFEVKGGTEQPLRKARGPASKNYAPGEPYSFLLIVALLAALGFSAYSALNNAPAPAGVSPDAVAAAGRPVLAVGMSRAVTFVVTLAVIAPLIMGAWYAACKIINVKLPPNLFLRSAGLAALAAIAVTVASAIPAVAGMATIAGLACVPIGYALLQFVHAQKPAVAGITVGLGALAGAVGLAVASSASSSVEVAMRSSYDANLRKVASDQKAAAERTAMAKSTETVAQPETKVDAAGDKIVADARAQIAAFKKSLSNKQQTQKPLRDQMTLIAGLIASGKQASPDRPEWATLQSELDAASAEVAAFPNAEPPAELTQAQPAGADWSIKPGRREVSTFAFNLTPPLEGVIDIDKSDPAGSVLRWEIGGSKVDFTVEQATAPSADQQRPWVAPAFVVNDAKDAAFAIAAEPDAQIEHGTINGLPATKITQAARGDMATYVYAVHKGATWLKVSFGPVSSGDAAFNAAQQAVRSLRERPAGEPVIDPMPASVLVDRFETDPSSATKLIGMLRDKPNAEDAVLKAIGFAPDDAKLERFGPLLAAVATEKSSYTLWKLAASPRAVGEIARETLRTLEPKTADDIAFAVLDVKSSNAAQVQKGLNTLAYADVDKERQPTVCKALASGLESSYVVNSGNTKTLEAVLEKWMDPELSRKVLTLLDTSSTRSQGRLLAMRVLAATGDKKYVMPIFDKVITDTDAVTETLIGMGANAESEVARLITKVEVMRTPIALKAGLAVLSEIGTQRSMSALQTIASKSGDVEAKETAKLLVASIKEKTKAAPAK